MFRTFHVFDVSKRREEKEEMEVGEQEKEEFRDAVASKYA